jgi:glycosyltransferase involved in cell wall biosynthesis
MRLLILTPEFERTGGGISTYYRALAPSLRDLGVEIHVVEGSALSVFDRCIERISDGIRIQTLDRERFDRWFDKFSAFAATPGARCHLAAAWAMWELAHYGDGYDVVEATDWGLLFVPPAVEAVRPLIVQCHGSIGQIAGYDPIRGEDTQNMVIRLIERSILANANVQTYSFANCRFWRAETAHEVTMVRPAWRQVDSVASDQLGDRGLVVGRLQRWKGPQVLCGALRLMGSHAPNLDWVGRDTAWGDRERSTSGHLAANYPEIWGSRVEHYPPIDPTEVARRQSSAFFNLVPSTWDTFNFTAVEAMASGRPTIVSTGAGASELIRDGENGYHFISDDPHSLADALERLMAEKSDRLFEIGRAAQETVRIELDPHAIAERRISAYLAAIKGFETVPPAPMMGWIGEMSRPAEPSQHDEMAFLDHMPLRSITTHVLRRARRKAIEATSWRRLAR